MSALTIVAVIAVVIYVIARQLLGEAIRAKRLIILPAILAAVGILDLAKHTVHPTGTDIVLIALGASIAAAICVTQGRLMRLEDRDGGLWGQLPINGLWLWVLLLISRGALIGLAHATNAHVAAGSQSELLILGANRLGQAAIIATRAIAAGIPLTAEKDASHPLAGRFSPAAPTGRSPSQHTPRTRAQPTIRETSAVTRTAKNASTPTAGRPDWARIARQVSDAASDTLSNRMQDRRSGRRNRRGRSRVR